tara:strand:+ start:177 stop:797 length:621 start_codon:yes stop_codon:yes gene_type:complete
VKSPYRSASDCDYNAQYLNNTSLEKEDWKCELCPEGAFCEGDIGWNDVIALQGWWRVPWSKDNSTFDRCPYQDDCLGANGSTVPRDNITERCLFGTTGTLCSMCIDGYFRDGGTCNICSNTEVPQRIGVLVIVVLLLSIVALYCRRRIKKKFQVYRPLWRDFLNVIGINITFAQINSSLPYVIDIQWPPEWRRFVEKFKFVNIDLM